MELSGLFNEDQLYRVQANLRCAAEHLESFYCFSPREWFHYSYELITARDLPADFPSRNPKVFAEVARRPAKPSRLAMANPESVVYSVVLFDENILNHIQENPAVPFDRLTLYILTHELVHIARFFHLIDYDTPDVEKMQEELKVHSLTARILAPRRDTELVRLGQAYISGEYCF